ncbi:hypothetical protein SAMN05444581_104128 [Methylocapsa palsarum]|uniref:Uncharacterized protein n=1 Tax=Methylocapsa palsarum TaxID=1612308 RepID=A0A1I3XW66_9HYPH|nr:hypothetical protein SAMN05444581_104128 [Methylocapsa palsarum]
MLAAPVFERFATEWNHAVDQKSLESQKLEHILGSIQSNRNMLLGSGKPASSTSSTGMFSAALVKKRLFAWAGTGLDSSDVTL